MTGCVQYCKKDQLIRLILVKSQKFEKKSHNSEFLLRIKKKRCHHFFYPQWP